MRTDQELNALIARIKYKDYSIKAHNQNAGITVTILFMRPDTYTGVMSLSQPIVRSGIDPEADDGTLYQLIFGMLMGLEEHECREAFQVDGERPFGPHMRFEALMQASRDSRDFAAS